MNKEFSIGLTVLTIIRLLYGSIVYLKGNQSLLFNNFLDGSNLSYIEIIAWILFIYGFAKFVLNEYKVIKNQSKSK